MPVHMYNSFKSQTTLERLRLSNASAFQSMYALCSHHLHAYDDRLTTFVTLAIAKPSAADQQIEAPCSLHALVFVCMFGVTSAHHACMYSARHDIAVKHTQRDVHHQQANQYAHCVTLRAHASCQVYVASICPSYATQADTL